MPKTKTCTNPNCDQPIKPATPEFFHRDPTQPDGLRGECKDCRNKKERPKRVGKYQKKEKKSLTPQQRAENLTEEFLGWWEDRKPRFIAALEDTIDRGIEIEREEIAKDLERIANESGPEVRKAFRQAAAKIRARGKNPS